jgi:hypothetical protein
MNPLDKDATWTLSEGNLKVSLLGVAGDDENIAATMAVPNSKLIYFEAKPNNSLYGAVGIAKLGFAELNPFTGSGATLLYLGGGSNAKIYVDGSIVYDIGATWSLDIIGVAVDMSNSKVWFSKNGSWLGSGTQDPETNTGGFSISPDEVMPYGFKGNSNVTQSFTFNFGQDSTFSGAKPMGAFTDDNSIGNFQYAPPAGYLALCTANLPTPTIIDGSDAFNTVTYTGTGTTNAITGVGFSPDFVWGKQRSGVNSHELYDTVRGVNQVIYSDIADAEGTNANGISSFDADGYTVAGNTSINLTSASVVAWNWKAGGAAVSNTDGSITSQVSANVNSGFSIVSYTGNGTAGATIGHGLSTVPDMIILQTRTGTNNRDKPVYHSALGNTKALILNTTAAQDTWSGYWNNTSPSSTVFTVGNDQNTNTNGSTMIAYCFANSDIIKAGSYTGNGSTDGPFVFTGGKVQWLMIKRTDAASDWIIWDAKRDTYNELSKFLYPNLSSGEAIGSGVADLLSNGFKLRNAGTANRNASGGTYIYLCIMESPFKHSNAR